MLTFVIAKNRVIIVSVVF